MSQTRGGKAQSVPTTVSGELELAAVLKWKSAGIAASVCPTLHPSFTQMLQNDSIQSKLKHSPVQYLYYLHYTLAGGNQDSLCCAKHSGIFSPHCSHLAKWRNNN